MTRRRMIIIAVILFLLYVFFQGAIESLLKGEKISRDKIALIHVTGVIMSGNGTRGGLFRETTTGSETIMEALREVQSDPAIKACVIRLNSPGGSVAASQEIYEEILKTRKRGKKVVASMGDVAASGAYYAASACDTIIANPGTITGSIGAIWSIEDVQELVKKIGLKFEVIKSGKYKDVGSPFRTMSKEDKMLIRDMVMDVYDQFVGDVASGRKLDKAYVRKIADGRILTGRKARDLKLVDKLGNLEYALEETARLAGIHDKPRIVELGEKMTLWESMFGALAGKIQEVVFSF